MKRTHPSMRENREIENEKKNKNQTKNNSFDNVQREMKFMCIGLEGLVESDGKSDFQSAHTNTECFQWFCRRWKFMPFFFLSSGKFFSKDFANGPSALFRQCSKLLLFSIAWSGLICLEYSCDMISSRKMNLLWDSITINFSYMIWFPTPKTSPCVLKPWRARASFERNSNWEEWKALWEQSVLRECELFERWIWMWINWIWPPFMSHRWKQCSAKKTSGIPFVNKGEAQTQQQWVRSIDIEGSQR